MCGNGSRRGGGGGVGSPLAGFPSNKEVWFLDDFSEVISHLAILLTDILSLQYSGFFDVT
jgi:hypothetical protein